MYFSTEYLLSILSPEKVLWNFLQIPRTGGTIAIHSQEKKYTETSVGSKINREFGKWTA
ncbi:uncharacterized protein LOC143224973 isoform X2 [Tachypleus tridentatus]|uniref:uncharacterized protein LOC143224973 isoform X2 n=1 Tax=Tachypleus tridentatus TaxID=6853 RepID=UPI003FD39763